ncbi:hypothetical protein DFP72DRAFT_879693 [Ephemerocybe angulata]|uniref:histidine kinase n=1 Tax=Ephemerocybe angulata TaxID=980116 RepID=A0A8H6MF78_9AGAR|nr:hypothetical protein DFP72DRAFT_879693 [Tulosesus angulatus]
MSGWLRTSNSRKSLNVWADDVASEVMKEKSQSASSRGTRPTTSTLVEPYGLPPPATHGERYSIASGQRQRKKAHFSTMKSLWAQFKSRLGTGSAPSTSSVNDESAADSTFVRKADPLDKSEPVDEVVVDRVWSDEFHSTPSHSEQDDSSPEKTGSHDQHTGSSDASSTSQTIPFLDRMFYVAMEVFSSRFEDEKKERHYQQEDWYVKKRLAIWTSLWVILSWGLGCAFTKLPGRSLAVGDKVFLFAVAPLVTVPVLPMVLYNWPRDRTHLYQITVLSAVWCWSFYNVGTMRACRFFGSHPNCGDKDFLGIFYWTTALQTIALFGLKLNRFPAAVGALCFFLFSCIAIIPQKALWARLLIYVHYIRESSERRLYTLRDQLKIQYRATQKAQINERKASDSKRRLTSYVRVPLNTALLAVQNMSALGAVAKEQELEFHALSGSLSMMSKVLNDVLDFNRLDSGKFESASKPYTFHQVMRSLFIPLRLAANARGLSFEASLDRDIDKLARRIDYEALGTDPAKVRQHIRATPDVDGVVIGDEARLRQIVTNLASNACKFTPAGGRLKISTRLVLPRLRDDEDPLDAVFESNHSRNENGQADDVITNGNGHAIPATSPQAQHPLSTDHLTRHDFNTQHEKKSIEQIVVRIEVTDTGCGIKHDDMAKNKLFSGKGTGLGLALVRQIVKFSGGRLGVQSKPGEGSTFWVELPLGVGKKTVPGLDKIEKKDNGDECSPPDGGPGHPSADHPNHDPEDTSNGQQHVGLFETPLNDKVAIVPPRDLGSAGMRTSKVMEVLRKHQGLHGLMDEGGAIDSFATAHQGRRSADSQEQRGNGAAHGGENGITYQEPRGRTVISEDVTENPTTIHRIPRSHDDTPASEEDLGDRTPKNVGPFGLNQPPLTTSTYQTTTNSTCSTSPMVAFDKMYSSGSPESSNAAVNVEPGLEVLVVDDDPLTRTLMTRFLTRLGCVVTTASNGVQALDLIVGRKGGQEGDLTPGETEGNSGEPSQSEQPPPKEGKYAVVFLDNQMPVMSGVKAVEKLREMGRSDFVVGVTGNALLTDQQEYLSAGVDKVLTKPVLEIGLREMLVAAEERRREAQMSLIMGQDYNAHTKNSDSSPQLTIPGDAHPLSGPSS